MIKNRDIIAFGLPPWDSNIATTLNYTAIEMSKHNRVLFVNPPLNRFTRIKDRKLPDVKKRVQVIRGKLPDIEQVNDNMWVLTPRTIIESINWISNPKIFDFINKTNEKRLTTQIKKAIKRLNFKDYILFNDNSMIIGFYFVEMLRPVFSVYLLRDNVTLVSYHSKHGKRLEPILISKMDMLVANSDFFADFGKKFNPHSYMIGQGCDLERYNDTDGNLNIPLDLKAIEKKPIIGYVGYLTSIRLDISVLVHIATERPNWSLVLVGPEDDFFKRSKLHSLTNVFFLGRKDPSELPGYIKGFDVAINPQIVNPITDINYPLKIDEYLAMGKPTVATRTSFMKYFENYVGLASTKEEYIREIENALTDNNLEDIKKRVEFAKTHSWEAFVNKIYGLIDEISMEKAKNKKEK